MGTKFLLRPPFLVAMLIAGTAIAQQPAHSGSIIAIDHIVAVVNENVITRHELDEMLKNALKQLQKQGIQPPEPAVLEKQLLERVILNRVQLQLAKETGLTVSDTELDQTLRRIAQENKMSLQEFYNALEQDGISFNKFRDEIRDEIILVRLKEREVNNRINVTEGEVDNFLQAQENSSDGGNDEYRIAHILVQLPEQPDALKIQAMRKRVETALDQLKSGVEFARFRGEKFTQTLEPRLLYLYVPFRDQSFLPNFDSAKTDFSFAQMLSENRFSGSDRINDANQVTFALTSRLIEADTGKERLRLAIGQQISLINRRITLDAPETIDRRPDLVAAVTGFITPKITTDSSVQFDQSRLLADVVRSGLSYRPEPGKVVNFGYRFTREVLHQVDASSQWRWSERWQTVARLNYSLQDQRVLEGLAGIEYNACCWSLRFVVQHLTLATQRTTTAAFLQLELNGLMQIGSNPLQVLQRSIPGYTRTGSQGSGTVEGP